MLQHVVSERVGESNGFNAPGKSPYSLRRPRRDPLHFIHSHPSVAVLRPPGSAVRISAAHPQDLTNFCHTASQNEPDRVCKRCDP